MQNVMTMKVCTDMNDFRNKFAKVFKKTAASSQSSLFDWEPEA
jgi:hypothetical protein